MFSRITQVIVIAGALVFGAQLCLAATDYSAVQLRAGEGYGQETGGTGSSLLSPITITMNGPTSLYVPASTAGLYSSVPPGLAEPGLLNGFDANTTIVPGVSLNFGIAANMARSSSSNTSGLPDSHGMFLWSSGANAPYVALTSGASYVSASIALTDDLHLQLGEATANAYAGPVAMDPLSTIDRYAGGRDPLDPRRVHSSFAGLSWDFADWGDLGVVTSQTSEKNGMLDTYSSVLFDDSAATTALGVSARVGFGNGWVTTASYNEGVTQLDLRPNSLALASDSVHSRAYGISIAKNGLFGNDSIGFAVTRPLQLYGSDSAMIGIDRSLMLGHEHIMLAGGTPETDFELGYVTTFMDGALALQTNAAYQTNLAGTNTTSLAVVSRAKISF